MNAPLPLILDCDPGVDDFVAILMILAASERFNLLGITVSGGNVALRYTAENTLKACELAGRRDVKVYAGCPGPLLRTLAIEDGVHGETGLKGITLPPSTLKLQPEHAVDFLIETLMTFPQKVTLATTAPLTNVALAIVREPRVLDNIEEIVTMGGSMHLGNITPAAEYNFYADPEAAHILYTCGKKITTIGIDVTHQAVVSLEWLEQLKHLKNPVAKTIFPMLHAFREYDMKYFEVGGGVLHDPCVIGYLLKRSLFKGKDVHVEVDTSFSLTRGRTVVDWWHKRGLPINAHVFNEVNAEEFFDLLLGLLARYGGEAP